MIRLTSPYRALAFNLALAGIVAAAWACGDDAGTEERPLPQDDAAAVIDAAPVRHACTSLPRAAPTSRIELVPVFPKLAFARPTGLYQVPGDPSMFYETEQDGHVNAFANVPDPTVTTEMLAAPLGVDLGTTEEGGLLGFAFHPNYATNGTAFISYTIKIGASAYLTQRIGRFTKDAGGKLVKESDIFEREVPPESTRNEHNVGNIVFGPDGNLYVGVGDAWVLAEDPANPAQLPNSVFGKILRIGVGPTGPYTIPDGNPYKSGGGAPEIFATGFRNPWRFSFDKKAPHDLWVGDVGDDTWEEINKVELGKNYGWNVMEGVNCFEDGVCNKTGLVLPITHYKHINGQKATIGGFVYRGKKYPELDGTYFFADFSGVVFSLPQGQTPRRSELHTDLAIVSFAEDLDGELYVLAYESLTRPAKIFQIRALPKAEPSSFPETLSATGCFPEGAPPTEPIASVVPFDVNSPLWSDGAAKRRWLAVPAGTLINVQADGDFDFPNGTTLIKEFRLENKPVETRLLVRHADGEWAGYSYEWNEAGTDAVLLDGEKTKTIGLQEWFYPSRAQCMRCHTAVSGRALGPEIGQLNRNFTYPDGKTENQLAHLAALGMINKPIVDPAAEMRFPAPNDPDPIELRARAYLHANCAFCHRTGGPTDVPQDFNFQTPLQNALYCNAVPVADDFGIPGARVLAPGNPAASIIPIRMRSTISPRMPSLGSAVVDQEGVKLIEDWITGLTACP